MAPPSLPQLGSLLLAGQHVLPQQMVMVVAGEGDPIASSPAAATSVVAAPPTPPPITPVVEAVVLDGLSDPLYHTTMLTPPRFGSS